MALRISVVLPVYNEERLLEEALDSLVGQTECDFEVIAVDDGSTDGTPALLDRFAAQDGRVRPVRQPHAGIVAALNRGLAEAQGAYVARMDADDVANSERLRLQADFLDRERGVGLVGSRV